MDINNYKVIDLSRTLTPGQETFKLELNTFFVDEYVDWVKREENDWYIIEEVLACSHVGTHIEVPLHHVKEGKDCAEFPLEKTMGEAIVLDFSDKKSREPITAEDIRAKSANMKKGDIVLLREKRSKYYNTKLYLERPYLTFDAAEYLVKKGMKCIGVDAEGIENDKDINQPIHRFLLERDIPIIEELQNLESINAERVFLISFPLKIKGLDASPARVVAFERKNNSHGT